LKWNTFTSSFMLRTRT